MKRLFTAAFILLIFSSIFLLFSLLAYSSTSNAVSNRLEKLSPQSPPINIDNNENCTPLSLSSDVYIDLPSLNTESDILKESTPFCEEPSKVVYITIDDGPNPITTPLYLETLKGTNTTATFFMTGNKMEKYPDLVKEISADGHTIGNHSFSHNYTAVYKNIYSLEEEITKTQEVIYSLVGNQPKIFRAPGGSTNLLRTRGLVNKIHELGYSFFDWNVSAADTDPHGITKEEVIDNIKTYSKNLNRVIILMHDNGRSASSEALPELIAWFKENGYEFRTLNESIQPIYLSKKIS